jgi:hypothetical protein
MKNIHPYINNHLVKNKKYKFQLLLSLLISLFVSVGCEKEIKVKNQDLKNAIVVEGHIENGIPPYVLLTKNKSYYGNVNINDLSSYFVNGANITVITDNDSVQLVEYNSAIIQTLPDSIAIELAAQFGINISSASEFPPITIYTVAPTDIDFIGVFGKKYDLRIEVDGKTITSSTTIPAPTFFDSLWIEAHPNPSYADSFFVVRGRLPITPNTYFRLFTSADGEAFRIDENAYTEEFFANGKINFSIIKGTQIGAAPDYNPNFATLGYWSTSQDTVCTVKLSTLDKPHYEFWRTLDENRQSQGNPFSSLVYVKSNVIGALGVWGGYGSVIGTIRTR